MMASRVFSVGASRARWSVNQSYLAQYLVAASVGAKHVRCLPPFGNTPDPEAPVQC